jgi:hypothetical protein
MPDVQTIASLVSGFGATGVLILGIWAFMTGKLWPKEHVDKVIEANQRIAETTAEIMSKEICEKIAKGVEDGIAKGIATGYLQINGGTDDRA